MLQQLSPAVILGLQTTLKNKLPCSVPQGAAHGSTEKTHKPTHKRTSTASFEKLGLYFFSQTIVRNVLLFTISPTNVQQFMPKKYKMLCYRWGNFSFLQHCPIEIVLTHGAWGLLLLRRTFPMVNWYFKEPAGKKGKKNSQPWKLS